MSLKESFCRNEKKSDLPAFTVDSCCHRKYFLNDNKNAIFVAFIVYFVCVNLKAIGISI